MDIASGDSGTLGSPLGLWMLDEEASSLIDNEMFHLKSCPKAGYKPKVSLIPSSPDSGRDRPPGSPGSAQQGQPFLTPSSGQAPSGPAPLEPSLPRSGFGAEFSSGCQIYFAFIPLL